MNISNFSSLYTQYYRSSFLFVKSYVRDDMATEDIVSESLISLWETIRKEPVEFPHALLVTMLKNNALNYLKHQDVRQVAMQSISSGMERDLNYRISTLQACEPEEIFSAEISAIVERTLLSLPEQTRRIFEMSRNEHLSVKEIAEQLSMNPKSIEYHITQSLKALRVALKDYLPAYYVMLLNYWG